MDTTPDDSSAHAHPLSLPHKAKWKESLKNKLPWAKSKSFAEYEKGPSKIEGRSETAPPSSGRQSQTSVLDLQRVNEEYTRQRKAASSLQSSTPLHRRISWAIAARNNLSALIDDLQRGNNEIESLLDAAHVHGSALLLPPTEKTSVLSSVVRLVGGALKRLHDSLVKVNAGVDSVQPCRLSIQLREDCEANRHELAQEPNVQLRDDSYVFNLQRHRSEEPQDTTNLLLAETLKNHPAGQASPPPSLDGVESMHELRALIVPDSADKSNPIDGVETLGFIRTPSRDQDTHILFHDASRQWCSPVDLSGILRSPEYRQHMNPRHIVQLTRLIMTSHLYLLSVQQALDVDPRPTHYRYFGKVGEDAKFWKIDDPLVLRPWLSFGFGSRTRRYQLGEGSGIAKATGSAVVALGLVLYQVCAGDNVEYGSGDNGLMIAKSRALKELNRVDNSVGSTVSDIIESLLSPATLNSTNGGSGYNNEIEFILNAITTLATYENFVEDTATSSEIAQVSFQGQVGSQEEPPPDPERSNTARLEEQRSYALLSAEGYASGSQMNYEEAQPAFSHSLS